MRNINNETSETLSLISFCSNLPKANSIIVRSFFYKTKKTMLNKQTQMLLIKHSLNTN